MSDWVVGPSSPKALPGKIVGLLYGYIPFLEYYLQVKYGDTPTLGKVKLSCEPPST